MKKINPKDLEVNPKNLSKCDQDSTKEATDNTGLMHCESYDCRTDYEDCYTKEGVCYRPTLDTKCNCDTEIECNETKVNCPDPASKGPVCQPLSKRPTECELVSRNCISKDFCPVTEQDNCNSDGIQCVDPKTYACQLHTEGTCGEITINCDPETGEKCQNTEQGAGCNQMSDDPGECTMISADCVD